MKQFVFALVIVCGVCAGLARDAQAQTGTWADRGYFNISFGMESGSSSLTDTQNITIYEEAGTISSNTTWTSGSLIDAGAGFRVWRNMTVGLAYHQEENDTESALSGSIPSPIFFNRPRELNEVVQLDRKEKAVHLVLGWALPINEKFDVVVSGGPSFFRLEQDSVEPFDSSDIREGGTPFTTVTLDIDRATQKKSLVGFNVGADATYIFWSNDDIRVGGGGFVRFTQASGDIQLLSTEQSTEVGGVQFGFGARIRF